MESGQRAPQLDLTRGFSERLRQVPEGLLILSSCKSGQLSYEEKDLGHGVFAHYLLDGLNGKADARGPDLRGNGDGRIDIDELFNYASTQTGKYVLNKFTEAQTPELYGVRRGPIDLLAALPDVREIIDRALRAARSISNDNEKTSALHEIAIAQAKSGDFSSALDTAGSISDDIQKASALKTIAEAQAKAVDNQAARSTLNEALQTARSIAGLFQKATLLNVIAASQADVREITTANNTILEAIAAADALPDEAACTCGTDIYYRRLPLHRQS